MFKKIKEFYRNEQFNPGLMGVFINPYYLARRALVGVISELSGHIEGKTLDVGCGQKPYR